MDVFRCFLITLFFSVPHPTSKLKLGPQSFLHSYTRNFSSFRLQCKCFLAHGHWIVILCKASHWSVWFSWLQKYYHLKRDYQVCNSWFCASKFWWYHNRWSFTLNPYLYPFQYPKSCQSCGLRIFCRSSTIHYLLAHFLCFLSTRISDSFRIVSWTD